MIEQIYTKCLAQGAYFIQSKGEAVVIDPLRETSPYLIRAEKLGVKIKYIFETHFHADFVSGHVDLAKKTGAKIVFGPQAETSFDVHNAMDGEEFKVGDITIRAIHTPGHTPESTCYLLINEEGKEHALFTGDTLFIGDVGRPDLAQKATGLTQEVLAGWLYDSLRNKIMVLPDDLIIYPAHGQGSSCGKNMSSETWSTLGKQKLENYALAEDMTKDEFIKEVTDGLQAPPQYFAKNAKLNKIGYDSIDSVLDRGNRSLSIRQFETLAEQKDVLILDVRSKEEFVKGFIPNSWFIGLDGSFAPWVGTLIKDINQKIILVTPEGRGLETVRRLARVGYDQTLGFLSGGFDAWEKEGKEVEKIETINSENFNSLYKDKPNLKIVDVRKPGEWDTKHISTAQHLALDFMQENFSDIDWKDLNYLHCRSGYRSTVASSILYSKGIKNLVNVQGSFESLSKEAILEGSCPSLVS